jgi:hypothetical protein
MVVDVIRDTTDTCCFTHTPTKYENDDHHVSTSLYYVPTFDQEDNTTDSGEAKFLLTSTCTFCYSRRNKIPRIPPVYNDYVVYQSKPNSLHRLHDDIYYKVISDLQSTLKHRSGWFLLFWFPLCIIIVVSINISEEYN